MQDQVLARGAEIVLFSHVDDPEDAVGVQVGVEEAEEVVAVRGGAEVVHHVRRSDDVVATIVQVGTGVKWLCLEFQISDLGPYSTLFLKQPTCMTHLTSLLEIILIPPSLIFPQSP